jgi:hypothetical protein
VTVNLIGHAAAMQAFTRMRHVCGASSSSTRRHASSNRIRTARKCNLSDTVRRPHSPSHSPGIATIAEWSHKSHVAQGIYGSRPRIAGTLASQWLRHRKYFVGHRRRAARDVLACGYRPMRRAMRLSRTPSKKNLENRRISPPNFIFRPASTITVVPDAMLTIVVSTATANR